MLFLFLGFVLFTIVPSAELKSYNCVITLKPPYSNDIKSIEEDVTHYENETLGLPNCDTLISPIERIPLYFVKNLTMDSILEFGARDSTFFAVLLALYKCDRSDSLMKIVCNMKDYLTDFRIWMQNYNGNYWGYVINNGSVADDFVLTKLFSMVEEMPNGQTKLKSTLGNPELHTKPASVEEVMKSIRRFWYGHEDVPESERVTFGNITIGLMDKGFRFFNNSKMHKLYNRTKKSFWNSLKGKKTKGLKKTNEYSEKLGSFKTFAYYSAAFSHWRELWHKSKDPFHFIKLFLHHPFHKSSRFNEGIKNWADTNLVPPDSTIMNPFSLQILDAVKQFYAWIELGFFKKNTLNITSICNEGFPFAPDPNKGCYIKSLDIPANLTIWPSDFNVSNAQCGQYRDIGNYTRAVIYIISTKLVRPVLQKHLGWIPIFGWMVYDGINNTEIPSAMYICVGLNFIIMMLFITVASIAFFIFGFCILVFTEIEKQQDLQLKGSEIDTYIKEQILE